MYVKKKSQDIQILSKFTKSMIDLIILFVF